MCVCVRVIRYNFDIDVCVLIHNHTLEYSKILWPTNSHLGIIATQRSAEAAKVLSVLQAVAISHTHFHMHTA